MGQKLCCLRPSNCTDQNPPQNVITSSKPESLSGSNKTTLQDCLTWNSPSLNVHKGGGNENVQVFKQTRKRVYPSSSSPTDGISSPCRYYTPRVSFSSGRMERIQELREDNEENLSGMTMKMKMKKKVTFNIPEEADVAMFYSPKETFD